MKKWIASIFIAIITPAVGYASAPPGASLTGELSVTPNGATSYQLPLLTPPGTLKPTLSLQYSSQAGNGPLGMGWSLGGLSQLSRCPRVKTIDGIDDGALQFNGNDRLCLDGQRLILVDGTYGANNAEYRTQIDSGLKIVGKGAYASTSAWFEVRTQDGQVMEYGSTANSRRAITPTGSSTAVPTVWALSKVSDRFTNYYTVSYLLDSGMLYPQTISYAGNTNAGTTPARTLTLTWAAATERPDHLPVYVGGGVSATIKRRLSSISNNANPARYRLYYSTSDAQLSNLTKVEYCPDGSTTNCLKVESEYGLAKHPTTGKYTSDPQTILAAFGTNQGWGDQDKHPRELADVNGDGRLDIVGFFNDGIYVAFGTASGFSAPVKKLSYFGSSSVGGGWASDSTSPRMVADINGDGLADIVGFASTGVYVALSTGNGFAPQTLWLSGYGTNAGWANQNTHPRMLADVDGDGLLDMVGFANASVAVALNKRTSFQPSPAYSNITSTFTRNSGWTENNKYPRMMADMNGDGRDDIVGFGNEGVMVALASTTGFLQPARWLNGFQPRSFQELDDFYTTPDSSPIKKLFDVEDWGYQSSNPRYLYDLNKDGLPDILGLKYGIYRHTTEIRLGGGGPVLRHHFDKVWEEPGVHVSINFGHALSSPEIIAPRGEEIFYTTSPDLTSKKIKSLVSSYSLSDTSQDNQPDIITYKGPCTLFRPVLNGPSGIELGDEQCLVNGFTQENGNWTDKDERIIADIDGDGAVDVLGFSPAGVVVSYGQAKTPNQIVAFKDDLSESQITYSTLIDNEVYTKGTGSVFPVAEVQIPMAVVKSVASLDGLGGTSKIHYRYGDLRSHFDHGSLGFRWLETLDQSSGALSHSELLQTYPLTGSLFRTQSQHCSNRVHIPWSGCQTLGQEVSDWSVAETGATPDRKVYRPQIIKTTEHTWDPESS
ncbi:Repeat domain-containing protein [Halopseudomonas litoralis]|uniref:Repeat domain-containing protein n=1 Tax=Halopseudomonas litoralis TaxID=797277 RepID=A0A1H1QC94_9GAMM|nr:FG-GAP-like repeat-containing protein [Halopseudomonas litoralis]SDS21050.1 Repeat domain-containing protein [Halopseudomonas litoralis]